MELGDRLDERALRSFDELGYAVVRGAFEPDLLDALEAALVRHERVPDAELPPGCPRSWTPVINECRLMNVLECAAPFERLVDHPRILPWMRALVGEPLRLTAANSITRARGLGLPLHSIETATYRSSPTGPRSDQVTAVVWLSDCGPEDGPMVVFAGSHRTGAPDCGTSHPSWRVPDHDRAVSAAHAAHLRPGRAWEEVASYRELHVCRGDLIVFAESLWHGAREVRSARVRRSLYFSYSPYHFANWHGLAWSPALKARVTSERRELLEGPFIGTRFPGHVPPGVPERLEFPLLPDSELGPRTFLSVLDGARDGDAPAARVSAGLVSAGLVSAGLVSAGLVSAGLARAVARSRNDPGDLAGVSGRCALRLAGASERTLTLESAGITVSDGRDPSPDAVIEADVGDFARLFTGELEAVELFYAGRVHVHGDVRLAMRVASFLLA